MNEQETTTSRPSAFHEASINFEVLEMQEQGIVGPSRQCRSTAVKCFRILPKSSAETRTMWVAGEREQYSSCVAAYWSLTDFMLLRKLLPSSAGYKTRNGNGKRNETKRNKMAGAVIERVRLLPMPESG